MPLAEGVGVSRKTINTVENGVFAPSTVLALRLGAELDLRVEDLFSLPPPRPNLPHAGTSTCRLAR